MKERTIVLASASPRRQELMQMLGIRNLIVCPAAGEENPPPGAEPAEIVRTLASAKAREVARRMKEKALIVAADTIVWLDGRMLGKPHSEEEAFSMLKSLSGRTHEVYTGICLLDGEGEDCEAERTKVRFRELTEEEILAYIRDGEPMDKAGAYGAQGKGALFVRSIEGDFFNVMGLPVCRLGEMLARKGVSIL